MDTVNSSENRQYYLQDSRGNVGDNLSFWAKGGGGYTTDVSAAQGYTGDAAFKQHESRHSDVPWPADYVSAHTRPVVDTQYVKEAEAQAYTDSEQFYLQRLPKDWVGNDIVFIAADGKQGTTDLTKARVFSRNEVFGPEEKRPQGIAWPKAYIDTKSRPAADYHDAKLEEALGDNFKLLVKPEKPRREIYRCHGCGIFLSIGSYYSLFGCSRCGADNRP